jgi:hypothetical protein
VVGKWERRKDTAQVTVESGATHIGHIMMIIAGAVRDVTREIGEWATDVFEIHEAARTAKASEPARPDDAPAPPAPAHDAGAGAGGSSSA